MNEKKARIMVIDDDRDLLKSTAVLFGRDYSVSLVPSGKEALEKLSGPDVPDIILLDISMPEMNGFETLKHIKENENTKHIPVIFLTGMTDTEDELKGLQLGAADYIRKPFSQEILSLRLEMHLENARKMRSPEMKNSEKEAREILNDAEWNVVSLICEGYTGKEISDKLFFSYSYIKKLMASAREKLGVQTNSELKRKIYG